MRILGLEDISIPWERMDRGIREVFPEAEVRYLKWPPANVEELNRENLAIEKNGAEAGTLAPGVLETIDEFDPQVIMTDFCPVTAGMIKRAKSLEVIGCLRGGVENINVEASTECGIPVFNNAGRTANAVAEYTVGMMLAASRSIAQGHHLIHTGKWWRPDERPPELYGRTVGLIGFGNIAQKVAQRLSGFDVRILAYDPYMPDDVFAEFGARRVELKELLEQSDYVSLHARFSPETKGLIGEKELKMMKPTAYIINTARAGLIDEAALLKALTDKQIKGAALDVFWKEPISEEDPVKGLDNATLTPHLAGYTLETSLRTISLFLDNLKDFLQKHQSRAIINFDAARQKEIAGKMKLAAA